MAKNDESNSEQEQQKEEQKFSKEQYEMLIRCSEKEDMTEWNKWREEPTRDLIRLEGAKLASPNLKGANLMGANLKGAILLVANLEGAELIHAKMEGAFLFGANLEGANLIHANLEGAHLVEANLEGADLRGVKLKGANLKEADLARANLHNCKDVVFDSTYILNTRHIPKNQWHKLRNKYTGINLAFHLILLVSFVLIYSGKAMFYYGIHMGQEKIIKELNALEGLLQEELSLNEPNETSEQRSEIQKDIILATSEMYGRLRKKILKKYQDIKKAVSENLEEMSVWQILLSRDKGIWFQFTTIVLIIYNLLRYVLTRFVAPLSAEEDRSHYTPKFRPSVEYPVEKGWRERILYYFSCYRNLLWFDRVNSVLWYLALGSFAIHCYDWMTAPVLILK